MPVHKVVKLGGGLLAFPAVWRRVVAAIARAGAHERLVIVPGGGPFADAVRIVDARVDLSDTAAHWAAILGMDQYAHVVADTLERAEIVDTAADIERALDRGVIPVLAPYKWLRAADPLPHAWEVTSDSIAAWIAGQLRAPRLLLIKPPGSAGDLVDGWFRRTLPAEVQATIVAADQIDELAHLC